MKILTRDNLLAAIDASIGSKMYRHLFVEQGKQAVDILEDGRLACAFYVSNLLLPCQLVAKVHATVSGTVADMETCGWKKTKNPQPGDVIVWEALAADNEVASGHLHIGFFWDTDLAVSNSSKAKSPRRHHWTYGTNKDGQPKRRILAMYHHKALK